MKAKLCLMGLVFAVGASAADYDLDKVFYDRDAAAAKTVLAEAAKSPDDAKLQFAAGLVFVLQGLEKLTQDVYANAAIVNDFDAANPLLRGLGLNPPEGKPLSYEASRKILSQFVMSLESANSRFMTAAKGSPEVMIDFGRVQVDVDADSTYETSFLKVMENLGGLPPGVKPDLSVVFDKADAFWFQGYVNLLAGFFNTVLAYDWKDLHYRAFFHIVNTRTQDNPYPYLEEAYEKRTDIIEGAQSFGVGPISDLLAALHSLHFPLRNDGKAQLLKAHGQWSQVPGLSRETFKSVAEETDNNREWIPSPDQDSVTGMSVTQEQVDSWLEFTKKVDQILAGDVLLPFWRKTKTAYGVNLKKFFTDPEKELVPAYLIQGSINSAFLEKVEDGKEVADTGFFRQQLQSFGGAGNFFLFSVWFN